MCGGGSGGTVGAQHVRERICRLFDGQMALRIIFVAICFVLAVILVACICCYHQEL